MLARCTPWLLIVLLTLALGACGGDDSDGSSSGSDAGATADTGGGGETCSETAPRDLGGSFTATANLGDEQLDFNGGAAFGYVADRSGYSDGDENFVVRMLAGGCDARAELALMFYSSSPPEAGSYTNDSVHNLRFDLWTNAGRAASLGTGSEHVTAEITSVTADGIQGTFHYNDARFGHEVQGSFTAVRGEEPFELDHLSL